MLRNNCKHSPFWEKNTARASATADTFTIARGEKNKQVMVRGAGGASPSIEVRPLRRGGVHGRQPGAQRQDDVGAAAGEGRNVHRGGERPAWSLHDQDAPGLGATRPHSHHQAWLRHRLQGARGRQGRRAEVGLRRPQARRPAGDLRRAWLQGGARAQDGSRRQGQFPLQARRGSGSRPQDRGGLHLERVRDPGSDAGPVPRPGDPEDRTRAQADSAAQGDGPEGALNPARGAKPTACPCD